MTESEWQEISDFLAREIMGFKQKDAYGNGTLFWVSERDNEYLVVQPTSYAWMDWNVWRPYKDVEQAMLVLKTILAKAGKYAVARISIRTPPGRCLVTIHNWVATAGAPASLVRSPYVENEMQAICLAAKEWCDVHAAKTLA